jgi:hypothetical protein
VQVPHVSVYNLPPPSDPWAAVSAVGQLVSALFALFALAFAFWTIWQNNKTIQLQIFESIMHDIRDLQFKFHQEYKDKPDADKKVWDSAFFNTVEYFSFLVNSKILSDKRVITFFGDSIIAWYEGMYIKTYSEEHVNDPSKFSEFKALYRQLVTARPPKSQSVAAN